MSEHFPHKRAVETDGPGKKTVAINQIVIVLIIFALGAVGIGGLFLLKREPEKRPQRDRAPLVRVMEIKARAVPLVVRVQGTARFKRKVEIKTQVAGKIVRMSPNLVAGGYVKKDETLVEIEPTDYTLAIKRAEADLRVRQRELERLRQDKLNAKRRVDVIKADLELAEADVKRFEKLYRESATSQALLDKAKRNYLQQKSALVLAENSLALFPARIRTQEALIQQAEVLLEEARLALGRTKIKAPFDGVVVAESVEIGQVLAVNQLLGVLGDYSAMEVRAIMDVGDMRNLPSGFVGGGNGYGANSPVDATVVWRNQAGESRWRGRLLRLEIVDETTRTVPVVVRVDEPDKPVYSDAGPARLLAGLFCDVEIKGKTLDGVFVIPRSALREGDLIYLEKDGRLEIKKAVVRQAIDDSVILEKGVRDGDRLVLSSLLFPVEGMRLRVHGDGKRGRETGQ